MMITYKGKTIFYYMWQDLKYVLLVFPCGFLVKIILNLNGKYSEYQDFFAMLTIVLMVLILKALPLRKAGE